MLERERIANRPKHWVRLATACNSRCVFCLDMDTPRNVFLPRAEVEADLRRGIDERGATKVILSGGEATLHPEFTDIVCLAREFGYERVQTVTNGWNLADRAFYRACMAAGLGEITFSLHGHTAELHDRLTRHPGSWARLLKGMVRALRDPHGPIVNVDVVINKQNVAVLDRIVELCVGLGVTEFDLLHVIPQAEAFRQRDDLFYDVREHMDTLHKVFRLNRHPRLVIWTNRFPVSYLEGLEDLIQDPHKMLDEINGRRLQVRRYLDAGTPLDCRQPERCQHCFIEPFCTTTDRVVARQNAAGFEVWEGSGPLPFGCTRRGVRVARWADLPVEPVEAAGLPAEAPQPVAAPVRAIAETAEQLDAWLSSDLPVGLDVEIRLNRDTAAWMLAHRGRLAANLGALRVHQPSYETLAEAAACDVRDPAVFYRTLDLNIQTSGLPACLAPGARLVEPIHRLSEGLFQEGRLDVQALARHHVREGYRARSERCRDCAMDLHCDGIHVNMIRDQGLALARPLAIAPAGLPLRDRVAHGRPAEPVAPSLPGCSPPPEPPRDPLAIISERLGERRAARRAARGG